MPVKMELTLSNVEPTIAHAMVLEVSESKKGEYGESIWK